MEINTLSNVNLQCPSEGTKLNQTKGFVQNDMASSDLGVIYTHGTEEKFTTYTRPLAVNVNSSSTVDVDNYSTKLENFSTNTPAEVSPASLSTSEVQTCQNYLRTLGFYTGSTDGNATSTAMKTAIKNFQRVYGLSQNQTLDSATTTKLNTVYNSYYSCYNSSDTSEVVNKLGLDNTQKKNFALTWTFLRTGMGLTIEQAAGVTGNIFAESGFSASNAEDSKGYPGKYNSNYTYSTTDEVGYGLMQWTNSTRKANLLNIASNMNTSVSDINAQLACIRYEAETSCKSGWTTLKNCQSFINATQVVKDQIIMIDDNTLGVRTSYASTIYNAMM